MLLGELESTHRREGASSRIQLGFYCLRGRLQQRGEGSRWAAAQRRREVAARRSRRLFYRRSSLSLLCSNQWSPLEARKDLEIQSCA